MCAQKSSITGYVQKKSDHTSYEGVIVFLLKNDKIYKRTTSASDGAYSFKRLPKGDYKIVALDHPEYQEFGDVALERREELKFDIIYNDICDYDFKKGICPKDQNDKVIPIIYGLASKKNIEKEKRGEVKLAGTPAATCNPHWYCTHHKLEF